MSSCVIIVVPLLVLGGAVACMAADDDSLSGRHLILPVKGITARDIHDTFNQGRPGGNPHEAIDLLAPRGTPVLAVEAGIIQKLFLSKPGGLTIYEFDQHGVYCYYYAHLDRYAEGLKEGMQCEAGGADRIRGYQRQCSAEHSAFAFCDFQAWLGKALVARRGDKPISVAYKNSEQRGMKSGADRYPQ